MSDLRPPSGASVVLFGTYDATVHDRVAVLRDGLADSGLRVVEVNVPLRSRTAERIGATRSVAGAVRLALDVLRCWSLLVLRRLRTGVRADVVLVGYLGHLDVHLARLLFPRSLLVLDHLVGLADTAADRRTGGRTVDRLLRLLDRLATGAADLVLLDTEEQVEVVRAAHRDRCLVVPVGASDRWHDAGRAPDAPDTEDPTMRVVFFGQYTPLQGCPTVGAAAALLADRDDVAITMVGRGQDREATESAAAGAAVRWIDWLELDELVPLVRDSHVALGVFGTGPKARRVVPHKVFESAAAGCAVVTADTPPQRRVLGAAARYCPPGDPEALAAVLAGLAGDRAGLRAARADASRAATRFRPVRVVEELVEVLDLQARPGPRRRGRVPALTANAWLRWDLVAPTIEALPPGRVLEVGPGRGAVAARLVAMGHDYTAAELSATTRARTRDVVAAMGRRACVVGSTGELDPDEPFDLVCAFEVLEHIEDDAEALAAWVGLLRPGGTIVLSTPADPARFGPWDELAGHLRRYTDDGLTRLAHDAGLVDVHVRRYGAGLGDLLERGRDLTQRVRPREGRGAAPTTAAARTEASSSLLQPPDLLGWATRLATAPSRRWQRGRPAEGPGLVLVARRPD